MARCAEPISVQRRQEGRDTFLALSRTAYRENQLNNTSINYVKEHEYTYNPGRLAVLRPSDSNLCGPVHVFI